MANFQQSRKEDGLVEKLVAVNRVAKVVKKRNRHHTLKRQTEASYKRWEKQIRSHYTHWIIRV